MILGCVGLLTLIFYIHDLLHDLVVFLNDLKR